MMHNNQDILQSQQQSWQKHWDDLWKEALARSPKSDNPGDMVSDFAREVAPLFISGEVSPLKEGDYAGTDTPTETSKSVGMISVVELGCGEGHDSAYFARQGLSVEALDFSEAVLAHARQRYGNLANLTFRVANISQALPFADGSLDGLYARLSLHYFTDEVTRAVFREIWRVLKSGGLFAFMCKTPHDYHYGHGQEVERDMFVAPDNHVRHFFSEEYARACLAPEPDVFKIERFLSWEVLKKGLPVGFVKVIARKR